MPGTPTSLLWTPSKPSRNLKNYRWSRWQCNHQWSGHTRKWIRSRHRTRTGTCSMKRTHQQSSQKWSSMTSSRMGNRVVTRLAPSWVRVDGQPCLASQSPRTKPSSIRHRSRPVSSSKRLKSCLMGKLRSQTTVTLQRFNHPCLLM